MYLYLNIRHISLLILLACYQFKNLNDLINKVEADLMKIRNAAENSFLNRCNYEGICSYQACSYDLPEKTCNAEFLTAICSCYTPTGTNLIMDQFTIKIANVYKPDIDPDDQKVKEMVKLSQQLNPIFLDTLENNKYLFKWIYFASNVGTFAMYPGSCINKFDARYRPWYIGSATGAKNFILILDFSGSMSTDNRDSILKSAVSIILRI